MKNLLSRLNFLKYFLAVFFVGTFFLSVNNNVVFAQVLFPQPGITCGKSLDESATGPFDPKDPKFDSFKCCSSPLETTKTGTIDKSFVSGLPSPLKEAVGTLIDIVNPIIDSMPFFLQPGLNNLLPTFGKLRQATNDFIEKNRCVVGASPIGQPGTNNCYCKSGAAPGLTSLSIFCQNITSSNEQKKCYNCIGYDPNNPNNLLEGGIWTGVGCIRTSLSSFIKETVMTFGISLAGIIALLCIIYAAFQIQTSQGNPEKLKKGQELLTSCIMGLMLIIFSVFILRLIGVDILKIPGFAK